MYYLCTFATFVIVRKKFRLQWATMLPFLMVPVTLDYLKRDYYIKLDKKDYKEF